jgi:hypothetical protein
VSKDGRGTFEIRACVQQNKFVVGRWNYYRNAAPIDTRDTAELERGGGEDTASVARRNYTVGLAFVHQVHGSGDGAILFPPQSGGRFVVHSKHFAGMDYLHAVIPESAFWERGVNGGFITDQIKSGYLFVSLKSPLGAFDDNAAPMVAAHDIHCDSHRNARGADNLPCSPNGIV